MQKAFVILMVLMWFTACPSQDTVKTTDSTTAKVYAEIGGRKITEADLQLKLEEIPPYARAEYESESGRRELINRILEEEAVYLAAKEAGYEKNSEILDELEKRKKVLMMQSYYRDVIQGRLGLDEKEMLAYYNAHKEEFAEPAQMKLYQILVGDSIAAEKIKVEIEVAGKNFGELAKDVSLDQTTKPSGGYIGFARENEDIPILGHVPELSKALFAFPVDSTFGPYKMDDGWHLFFITEKIERVPKEYKDIIKDVRDKLLIKDTELESYYNEHMNEFVESAKTKVRHILSDKQEVINKALARLNKGEDFERVARELSTDAGTKDVGGLIGFIERDKYIRSVGRSKEFEDAAFALEPGTYSNVVKTEKGYHIIFCIEKIAEKQKEFSEVKEQIRSKLLANIENERIDKSFEDLRTKYGAKIYDDPVEETEEELFEKAQQASEPKDQLALYQKLMRGYPNGKYACDAQFMIGFILAEHLKDIPQAKQALQKVIVEFPNCDWVDDATWMLDDLESGKKTKELMNKLEQIENKGDDK